MTSELDVPSSAISNRLTELTSRPRHGEESFASAGQNGAIDPEPPVDNSESCLSVSGKLTFAGAHTGSTARETDRMRARKRFVRGPHVHRRVASNTMVEMTACSPASFRSS